MNENRYVIIMAGGVGSRFWPLSRQAKPKQFLDILGTGETFLQQTFRRFSSVVPSKNIYVVTNGSYKELVIEQLGINPGNILSEPFRRNTAPCIVYASFRIFKENRNAIIAVTPADHYISREELFIKELTQSMDFVEKHDALLTLGIKPDRPETGYGYIQADIKKPVLNFENLMKVKTFTEKPDLTLAAKFIQSGDFYWNSGIFISNINTLLFSFEKYLPDMFMAFDEGKGVYGTEKEKEFICKTYTECRNISIDYGVMEKADNVYVKCIDIGWSDLGTWGSLYEHSSLDKNNNSTINGKIFSFDNHGCLFNVSPNKIAVVEGLKDYIIVEVDDAILIVKKENEQNIRHYLEEIKKETSEQYI